MTIDPARARAPVPPLEDVSVHALETETPQRFTIQLTSCGLQTDGSREAFLGYEFAGQSCPDDGVWVKWTWDGSRFVLTNDRLGFRPVYYFASASAFGVGTRISDLVLAGAPLEVDDAAVAVFLRLGFFLGDDTPFRHIRSVPKDALLTWSDGRLRLESRNRLPAPKSSGLSRKSAGEAYGERFRQVVKQLLQLATGSIGLPLSGGRDSRHILLALADAGRVPDVCVTVAHAEASLDPEAQVASRLAERLGLRHVVLQRPSDRVRSEVAKNLLTSFCADEHAWFLPVREFFRASRTQTVFDGIGGDVLSAGLFLTEHVLELFEAGDYEQLAEHVLGSEGYLPWLLKPDFYSRWRRSLAVERLAAELALHANTPNPVAQFYFWNRTRREISLSPWGVIGDPPQVLAPYLAMDVYDLLSGLPATYFLDHNFHSEVIEQFYPEYAAIAYARKKRPEKRSTLATRLRLCRDLLQFRSDLGRQPACVSATFLLARLAYYLAIGESSRLEDVMALPVYLMQLESLARTSAR